MIKYLKMMSFVIVMGAISMVILIGADALTRDRIAKNAELTWKSAMLTHHGIEYNESNFAELFDQTFDIETKMAWDESKEITLYTNKENGNISFQFVGNGLWDLITGVISFKSDFETIIAITVTKQGETPGLGGIVAEKAYLDKFVGKKFDESLGIVISKNPSGNDYEVDAIVGATGTSNAFAGILNSNYTLFKYTFTDSDVLAPLIKALLTHNNVAFTDDNYMTKFAQEFTSKNKNGLTLYTHKSGTVNYAFTTEGLKGPIEAVITLASDFESIVKITVLSQSEGWGASIQTNPQVLANFEGAKFPNISLVTDPSQSNEVLDGFGGATSTRTKFTEGLNNAYTAYAAAFKGGN